MNSSQQQNHAEEPRPIDPNQLDLLSSSPVSRTNDPETSKAAEDLINRSGLRRGQQTRVARALFENPGQTSAEYGAIIGTDRFMPARRLPELAAAKLARRGKPRKCRETGNPCTIWWPTDKLARIINELETI